VLLAAAPAWFADNLPAITIGAMAVVAALVLWVLQKLALRVICLSVFAALALFVYVNRVPLELCARTCECRLVGVDITVPVCDAELRR
jgi:hypothetical protein